LGELVYFLDPAGNRLSGHLIRAVKGESDWMDLFLAGQIGLIDALNLGAATMVLNSGHLELVRK